MPARARVRRVGTVATTRSRTGGTDVAGNLAKIASAVVVYLVLQLAALFAAASLWVA